ncbi:transglutaminase domain protein [Kribbella flavida DSM 17836]|uniref:Transglutaminase domain protein n=1 Tax=Kribbella flavida (strain DSM 17836 / JCM 10339 / NBRC 14399) TaxID=479435 RepID=D2Q208_KRIFD|nr:transglutaminase-like domain-containing protein [Kribbella flavida]ADB33954.1 transglutaminase domain protein [Kribbella flavida DSM 17836]
MNYTQQTAYSDPGEYAVLLDPLPTNIPELTAVIRNLLIHYRGGGIQFTGERLEEINHRWIDALLATDQRRNGTPLTTPRAPEDRVAGCCRDYALLLVSALRHQGVPARTRIGFATYFQPGWNADHVITEYWNGDRWVQVDGQLEPGEHWGFDVQDLPAGHFRSAAEVWRGFRAGEIDGETCGVDPTLPFRGGWFIRDYVFLQLAHLQGDELLLWDGWGAMADDLSMDLTPTDELAALLLAADAGDEAAATKLRDRYREDPDLHPGERIEVRSPSGTPPYLVDLATRQKLPWPAG